MKKSRGLLVRRFFIFLTVCFVYTAQAQFSLQKAEYLLDTDTTVGNGIAISFGAASDTIEKEFEINITSLDFGRHFLFVRVLDSTQNLWSPWEMRMFYIEEPIDSSKIISYRHVIDESIYQDTSYTSTILSAPVDTLDFTLVESLDTNLSLGQHIIKFNVKSDNMLSSTTVVDTFYIIDCPMLDTADIISSGSLCLGDSIILKQDITKFGTLVSDSFNFNWFIDGSSTPSSTIDSIVLNGSQIDTLYIRFAFTQKSEEKCKGELLDTFIVRPTFSDTIVRNLCSGDSVLIDGSYYLSNDTVLVNNASQYGCDSLVTFIVRVYPTYNDTSSVSICDNDSISLHGVFQKTSGLYLNTYQTVDGCDSIVGYQLTVNPNYASRDTFEICEGDTLQIHGNNYTSAGIYLDSLNSQYGCDSLFSSLLIVHPVYTSQDTFEICEGDTLRVHGKNYISAGTYLDSFNTQYGCDSLFSSLLIVNPVYNMNVSVQKCGGDSFFFEGQYHFTSGTFIGNYSSIEGCDSTVTFSLIIDNLIETNQDIEICFGDSVVLENEFRKTAGVYVDSLTATAGCDSIVTTTLIVNTKDTSQLDESICNQKTYFFNGNNIGIAGVYNQMLSNSKGCDSLVVLDLKIRNENRINLAGSICFGDSTFMGNGFKHGSGTFIDTLFAADIYGCDSIIEYTQNEHAFPNEGSQTHVICSDDSVFVFTRFIKQEGVYTDTIQNAFGCDSLVLTDVRFIDTAIYIYSDTMCEQDGSYPFFGDDLTSSGVYRHYLKSHINCDSIVELHLTIDPNYQVKIKELSLFRLSTDTIYKTYQWYKNRIALTNDTNRIITLTSSSNFDLYDVSVTNFNDCLSNSWDDPAGIENIESVWFDIYPNPSSNNVTYIFSGSDASISVYNSLGKQVSSFYAEANKGTIDVSAWSSGIYYITFEAGSRRGVKKIVVSH